MLTGTIVMEDTVLHFQYMQDNTVHLTVCDAFTGQHGAKSVKDVHLAQALGIALHPDGDAYAKMLEAEYEALVEAVSPVITELGDDGEPETVQLRWLP